MESQLGIFMPCKQMEIINFQNKNKKSGQFYILREFQSQT